MKKVVLLPLDERPCNYVFPQKIFKSTDISVIVPSMDIMGVKKKPGNLEKIKEFLLNEAKDAYGMVLALDTLLYGGIVPSRLHFDSFEVLKERLEILHEIKKINPNIIIYAFQLIMRCPQYNSSDEEPDYYDDYGVSLFKTGVFKHKEELGILTEEEKIEYKNINIPEKVFDEFITRRNVNTNMNVEVLNYVYDKTIDFMIIPQDDSSEFGYTAMDQKKVKKVIVEKNLDLVCYMYPGADEVANTLLSRMLLHSINKLPKVYIKYNTISAPFSIPCLEDRYLDTTIKYQLMAAGALVVDSLVESDIVLLASMGSRMLVDPGCYLTQPLETVVNRNLIESIEYTNYCINTLNKPVMVADLSFLNGGDVDLVRLLDLKGLSLKVAAYAGWNTSSNTLGTTIPMGLVFLYYGNTKAHKEFLVARYLEDIGYCSYARSAVTEKELPKKNYSYFYVEDIRGYASEHVKNYINNYIPTLMPSLNNTYEIVDLYMPWRRMFEIGIEIKLK